MDRVKARIVVVQRVSSRLTGKSIDEGGFGRTITRDPDGARLPILTPGSVIRIRLGESRREASFLSRNHDRLDNNEKEYGKGQG